MMEKRLLGFLVGSMIVAGIRTQTTGPTLTTGPSLDDVTEEETRRYFEIAEEVCNRYKVLETDEEGNEKKCDPIDIPPEVGGKVAEIEEFPHMALVGWKKVNMEGYHWFCAGSLISNQYVLTTAHCGTLSAEYISGLPQVIKLGANYVDEPTALLVPIATIIIHPDYDSPIIYNDIALIKMATRVTFTKKIRPACLGLPPPVNESVIATGWDSNTEMGPESRDLRCVVLPVWGVDECNDGPGFNRNSPEGIMSDVQVCVGDRDGERKLCQGNKDGPIQIQDGCVWRVVGTISVGRSCGISGTAGIYSITSMEFIVPIVFGTGFTNGTNNEWYTNNDSNTNTNQINSNNNNFQTNGTNNDDINDAQQPNGSNNNIQQTTTSSNNNIQTPTGSNNDIQQTTTGSNNDIQQTTTGSNNDIQQTTTGSNNDIQPTTGSNTGDTNNVLKPNGSNNNIQQTAGSNNNIQQTAVSNNNIQPTTGSNNRIVSTINSRLWKNLMVINKLQIDIPFNNSVEINTTVNNNTLGTSVVINNSSIVNTIEIQ